MISIKIGNVERKFDSIDSDWINQQISNRRRAGEPVCVQVIIISGNINIALRTDGCPKGQFVERPINDQEKEIFEFWERLGLKNSKFHPQLLIDFLQKMHDYK